MGFWDRSLLIFKYLCNYGKQSVRQLAHQTGLPKSSVHRLRQAIERRGGSPEAGLWETEAGRQWLTRLVVATLYTFGLKRGVGVDTLSEFFVRLRLQHHLGCSPTALRRVMQALEQTIMETAQAWEQEGTTTGAVREIIGAVDETFLEHLMLVCMDLPSGYLLVEAVAADRTYTTWKAVVDERLKALGATVLYLVSDRAKALIQLAELGFECLSMPDFFHCVHDIVKTYSLAIGRGLRNAQQELAHAEARLTRRQDRAPGCQDTRQDTTLVEVRRAAVTQWTEVQHTYRLHLETLSLTLHPFNLDDATAQTSTQVTRRLHAEVEAIEALAARHQFPACHAAKTKVRKQLPALAALVDFWWAGVEQDLEHAGLSTRWRAWAKECLLPCVYWAHQVTHTRCARRKAKLRKALEASQMAFEHHALTQRLPLQALEAWKTWANQRVRAFQRTSSAVEGRNGYLSQMHHNHRGLPPQRPKVWTALHNFDGRAANGTTPAARFFGRGFPDLFETVLPHMAALPQPRQRKG
jgi:Family of unknown function (DUF6399)/IclR helix-turn-helix domain